VLVLAFFPTETDSLNGIVWSSLNNDSVACNKEMDHADVVAEIGELNMFCLPNNIQTMLAKIANYRNSINFFSFQLLQVVAYQ
jgi:hypothetical protein